MRALSACETSTARFGLTAMPQTNMGNYYTLDDFEKWAVLPSKQHTTGKKGIDKRQSRLF